MASFNSIMLVGNLGRDPELRYTSSGTPVCTFSVATNEKFKKGGEDHETVTWFRVTVFGRQAETCSQYLSKGRPVFVQGRMRVEEWTDKDGKPRWTAEVTADQVKFLGSKPDAEDRDRFEHDQRRKGKDETERSQELADDDIPF